MTDPYKILGIPRTATPEECKSAYRKLAKECHPDMHPGDKEKEERFKEISAAYEAITKPQPDQQANFNSFHFNLDEILHAFSAQQRQKNRDVQVNVQISMEDAFKGTEIKFKPNPLAEEITMKLPPGIDTGNRIRLAGKGDKTYADYPPGDIHVVVFVQNHPIFQRSESNLGMVIEQDLFDIMIGTTVGIIGIDGKRLELKIPTNFNPKQNLKLAKQGMPILNTTERGDLYVQLNVRYPHLTSDQISLLEKVRDLHKEPEKVEKDENTID